MLAQRPRGARTGVSPRLAPAFGLPTMPGPKPNRRSLLLTVAALAAIAGPAEAAPEGQAPAGPRERLVSIEIAVDGKGGVVTTEPEFIDGHGGSYRFGTACGGAVSEPVLQQMFAALHEQRLLRVVAEGSGESRCVARLTFYAR